MTSTMIRRRSPTAGQLLEPDRGSEAETADAEAAEETDEPTHPSIEANRIASEAVADADGRLPDFDAFCVTVELTQDMLLREVPG